MAKKITEKEYRLYQQQLEEVVKKMESDAFSMDEMATLMDQAKELIEKCKDYLTQKETEIISWQKKLREM